MTAKQLDVSYSLMAPEGLKSELIDRYGFDESLSCCLFKSGMNDIYQIQIGEIVYYLRVACSGIYDFVDYENEAAIMVALDENGVKTALPIRCKDGNYVWPINAPEGKRYVTLFTEAKNQPSNDSVRNSFNLGQSVAKLHIISDEKEFVVNRAPIDFTELIHKPMLNLRPYLERQWLDDYKFIASAMEDIQKHIANRLTTEKPHYGFCHGDIHLNNVFFSYDMPIFFDFDTMGYGWRAHDISVHIFNMELMNPLYREGDDYKAFFDGYNSLRQLSENELDCIDMFGAIRPIWALDINVRLNELKSGSIFLNQVISFFVEVFKEWHNKYIPGRQER